MEKQEGKEHEEAAVVVDLTDPNFGKDGEKKYEKAVNHQAALDAAGGRIEGQSM